MESAGGRRSDDIGAAQAFDPDAFALRVAEARRRRAAVLAGRPAPRTPALPDRPASPPTPAKTTRPGFARGLVLGGLLGAFVTAAVPLVVSLRTPDAPPTAALTLTRLSPAVSPDVASVPPRIASKDTALTPPVIGPRRATLRPEPRPAGLAVAAAEPARAPRATGGPPAPSLLRSPLPIPDPISRALGRISDAAADLFAPR